jgi:hypothetical protein
MKKEIRKYEKTINKIRSIKSNLLFALFPTNNKKNPVIKEKIKVVEYESTFKK